MTDHLTEAVRRLRQLQEDVERLKSARGGEIRDLRIVENAATADDVVVVGPDADVEEIAVSDDLVAVGPDATAEDISTVIDTAVARLNDAETTDTAQTSDSATVTNTQAAMPAVCDFDNCDKSDAG